MKNIRLERGMIINVNLDPTKGSETGKIRPCVIVTNDVYNERVPVIQVVPITEWTEKKSLIKTNVEVLPDQSNNLSKKSIIDCLQTRPIDIDQRFVNLLGKLDVSTLYKINSALKLVFSLE